MASKAFLLLISALFLIDGIQCMKLRPRIYGGAEARIGQFPYQISIREVHRYPDGEVKAKHFCGGALVSSNWVVTSARCMQGERAKPKHVVVVVGAHHIYFDGESYKVESIVTHPEFKGELNDMKADIALLKTYGNVEMSEMVQPIPIADHIVEDTDSAVVSGWGMEEDGLEPLYLKYLEVHIISKELCTQRNSKQHSSWIHNSTICTFKQNGVGICHGDFGNPLVMDGKLIGVASWSEDCAAGNPDQYTRISSYREFIDSSIAAHGDMIILDWNELGLF